MKDSLLYSKKRLSKTPTEQKYERTCSVATGFRRAIAQDPLAGHSVHRKIISLVSCVTLGSPWEVGHAFAVPSAALQAGIQCHGMCGARRGQAGAIKDQSCSTTEASMMAERFARGFSPGGELSERCASRAALAPERGEVKRGEARAERGVLRGVSPRIEPQRRVELVRAPVEICMTRSRPSGDMGVTAGTDLAMSSSMLAYCRAAGTRAHA